jgi:hypothetical protein
MAINSKIIVLGVVFILLALAHAVSAEWTSQFLNSEVSWLSISIDKACPSGWTLLLQEGKAADARVLCGANKDSAGNCPYPGTYEEATKVCVSWVTNIQLPIVPSTSITTTTLSTRPSSITCPEGSTYVLSSNSCVSTQVSDCTGWQRLLGRCGGVPSLSIFSSSTPTTTLSPTTTTAPKVQIPDSAGCMVVQKECFGTQCFKVCRDSYYDFSKDCCVLTKPNNLKTYNEITFETKATPTSPPRRIDIIFNTINLWFQQNIWK